MEEIHYNFYYTGPLLFKTSVSKNDLDDIKLLCKDHKNKNFKRNTTGIAEQEYKVDCFKLQNILQVLLCTHQLIWIKKPEQEKNTNSHLKS